MTREQFIAAMVQHLTQQGEQADAWELEELWDDYKQNPSGYVWLLD